MANKAKKKGFSVQGFDAAAWRNTEEFAKAVDRIYMGAVDDFSRLASRLSIDPIKPFSFNDYPTAKREAQKIVSGVSENIKSVVVTGTEKQWLFACAKNDAFLNHIINTSKVPKKTLAKYQDRNLDALDSFQNRKVNGLDLSNRIWNYSDQFKAQMELGIDIGIGDGKSAQALSRDLRQYLVDPDKLFRRVRDKHGNLVLSKAAKAFSPGQGKYRSSYKNAMRLTRTEINMAYRESDYLRWNQLDFVVGYEVKLSNNHTLNGAPFVDICDYLKGKYPKSFKFTSWHPQCRCFAIPILMEPSEYDTDELNELKAAINGTEYKQFQASNTITDVPEGFKSWITDNAKRSTLWKSQPFFIRDNFNGGTIEGGLKLNVSTTSIKSHQIPKAQEPKIAPTKYEKIADVENVIRKNRTFETAVVFDQDGNEFYRKKGEKSSVGFTQDELKTFKDKIFTHNHHSGWAYSDSSIKHTGNSFSVNDVLLGINYDMAEIRAVTPLYTFTVKRPDGGWKVTPQALEKFYEKENTELFREFTSIIENSGKIAEKNIERAEAIHYHALWKRLFKKIGVEYKKAKTG